MTCLAVFKENQETNSAVQKAAVIIHRLMSKYGVVVEDIPDDALEAEPATRTRDQQPQPQQRPQQVTNFEGPPTNTQNETSPQTVPTVEVNSTSAVPSPGSDWINIDGIIQSFLRDSDPNMNNDLTTYGPNQNQIGPQFQPPKIPQDGEHYLHQQQPVYFPANNFPAGMNPPVMEMEWGQNQYWSSNQDAAFMEDPIFGFNGSNSAEFQYMGR